MRSPIITAAVAATFVLAACGGAASTPVDANGDVIELPEPASGPVPKLPVSAASAASSPLPDIAVRQINGDGGWVQLKNEIPADKPLLVWFWAPH